jgi:hypothetical protein
VFNNYSEESLCFKELMYSTSDHLEQFPKPFCPQVTDIKITEQGGSEKRKRKLNIRPYSGMHLELLINISDFLTENLTNNAV